ncbi:hypothetical protein [Myroides odoratus]|uniref:hypothetical protein n=1 Tax=Myroides odoratus TaxID=256 RepID=UPI0021674B60|nr:hypothetical protein [Myroides odoratus]
MDININDLKNCFFILVLSKEKLFFTAGKITYLYTATGEKVQKKVTQGSTTVVTDYVDDFTSSVRYARVSM